MHCEHNAAKLEFSLKLLAAYFLSILWSKGFRTKSCSNVRTKWSFVETEIVPLILNVFSVTTAQSGIVNTLDIY